MAINIIRGAVIRATSQRLKVIDGVIYTMLGDKETPPKDRAAILSNLGVYSIEQLTSRKGATLIRTSDGKTLQQALDTGGGSTTDDLNSGVILTEPTAGITITTGGSIKGGQSGYDTGTGFFLGLSGGAYRFSIGDSGGHKFTFDGVSIVVTGNINSSSGVIGGWSISAAGISKGNVNIDSINERIQVGPDASNYVRINSAGILGIKTGGVTVFKLPTDGSAAEFVGTIAANGTFSGVLSAATGSFTGTVTATAGLLGGWTITSNSIQNSAGTITLDAANDRIQVGPNASNYVRISSAGIVGVSSTLGTIFNLPTNGTAPSFSGSISANTGLIGGWTITANGISKGNVNIDSANTRIQVGPTASTYVRIDASGITGVDSVLGTTFSLPTNGSAPTFSSGIIREVTFEMYTSGVIKTSANPASSGGALMNNTGIKLYDTSGRVRFQATTDGIVTVFGAQPGNLIYNGDAGLGSTVGFDAVSGFSYSPTGGDGGLGGFTVATSSQTTIRTDAQAAAAVNVNAQYLLSAKLRTLIGTTTGYAGFVCFDKDRNIIQYYQCWRDSPKDSVLGLQANAGSTTVRVTPAAQAWFTVVSPFSYLHIGNVLDGPMDLPTECIRITNINTGTNPWTLTLESPLQNTYPVGTKVGNSTTGSAYNYALRSSQTFGTAWTEYSVTIGNGVNPYNQVPTGANLNKFRRGTRYVGFLALVNANQADTTHLDDLRLVPLTESAQSGIQAGITVTAGGITFNGGGSINSTANPSVSGGVTLDANGLRAYNTNGDLWFDANPASFSLYGGRNTSTMAAVVNPGFESGNFDGWVGFDSCTVATGGVSGNYYCRQQSGASGPNLLSNNIGVVEGSRIFASAWVRKDPTTPATSASRFAVRFYNSAGAQIDSQTLASIPTSTTAWTYFSGIAVAPANAVFARIDLGESTGTGYWNYDDVTGTVDSTHGAITGGVTITSGGVTLNGGGAFKTSPTYDTTGGAIIDSAGIRIHDADGVKYFDANSSGLQLYEGRPVFSTALVNGGFESGDLLGIDLGASSSTANITIINNPANAKEGSFYARVLQDVGNTSYLFHRVPIKPDDRVWFSAFVREDQTTHPNGAVSIRITYYDSVGGVVAITQVASLGAGGAGVTNWTELAGWHTAPANAAYASFRFGTNATASAVGAWWVDNVRFVVDASRSSIEQGVTIAAGGLTLSAGGNIKGGQTSFDTGTGFFLGYQSGSYVFSIGNSGGNKLTFDGANLKITGHIDGGSLSAPTYYTNGTHLTVAYSSGGTMTVMDTSDFPTSGTAMMLGASGAAEEDTFTYTGKTATTLTGVSGAAAAPVGTVIVPMNAASVIFAQANQKSYFFGNSGSGYRVLGTIDPTYASTYVATFGTDLDASFSAGGVAGASRTGTGVSGFAVTGKGVFGQVTGATGVGVHGNATSTGEGVLAQASATGVPFRILGGSNLPSATVGSMALAGSDNQVYMRVGATPAWRQALTLPGVPGEIGSYAFLMFRSATTVTEGSIYAGSSLYYSGLDAGGDPGADGTTAAGMTRSAGVLSGSWMAMGRSAVAGTRSRQTLFVRIS